MANQFEYGLGYFQGKVEGGVEGEYCLCLGDFDERLLDTIEVGDHVTYSQSIDLTDVDYLRIWGIGEMPDTWKFEIRIDSAAELVFSGLYWKNTEKFTPIHVNVASLTGSHTIGFRLTRFI